MLYIRLLLWKPKNIHINHALKKINTSNNPVAVIKAQTIRLKDNTRSKNMGHSDNERTPTLINIAKKLQYQITGTNLCPKWGLYHRVRGKVLNIVYGPEHSPPDNLPFVCLIGHTTILWFTLHSLQLYPLLPSRYHANTSFAVAEHTFF